MATLCEIEQAMNEMCLNYIDNDGFTKDEDERVGALMDIETKIKSIDIIIKTADIIIKTAARERKKLLQSADQYIK